MNTQWLLENGHCLGPNWLAHAQANLRQGLAAKGLGFFSANRFDVRRKIIIGELVDTFSQSYLDSILQPEIGRVPHVWIGRMLDKRNRTGFPVYFLLIIELVGMTIQDLFRIPKTPAAVPALPPVADSASGPCANPVCSHFAGAPRLKGRGILGPGEIEVTSLEPVTCPYCNFSYRLVRRRQRWVVLETGDLWNAEFARLLQDKTISLGTIGKRLGVGRRVLETRGLRLGLHREGLIWYTLKKSRCRRVRHQKRIENNRRKWLAARLANPLASRSDLRHVAKGAYTYLQRFDLVWLTSHLPATRPRRPRVDWKARDAHVVERLRRAYEELLEEEGRPQPITNLRLIQKAEESGVKLPAISRLAHRMPDTCALLSMALDTVQFAERRLAWTIEYCRRRPLRFRAFRKMVGCRTTGERFANRVRAAHQAHGL